MKNIYLFTTVLLFTSCYNQGVYEEKLSGNFFYEERGENFKQIISHSTDNITIYSNVLRYAYNDYFITAIQKPSYKEFKIALAFEVRDDSIKFPLNSDREITRSENIADSLIKNNSYYTKIFANNLNYWIIDIKAKRLIGPLVKTEFLRESNILNIPKKLILEED